MVTSLNNAVPARDFGYGGAVQCIGGRITANSAVVNTKIGTLPAGALILAVTTDVETAISGGTTPAFNVGTASGGAQIAAAIALTAGSLNTVPLDTLTMPFAADTAVWAGLTGSPTAGNAYVVVTYVKPVE